MKKKLVIHNFILIFIALVSSERIVAQLGFCSGNSGDPIFSETFGSGTNYGPALPTGTIDGYTFVGNGGPQDGEYTLASSTFFYGWSMPSDHTIADTNGKALIVNASFAAGDFYVRPISGLCQNTTYEFSAWLMNILPITPSACGANGIPINVRFEIWDVTDTNLLATGNTGDVFSSTTPTWNQHALVFQTLPGQTSIILRMINNGVGGCGNDLAIDDIIFKSCGDFIEVTDPSGNNDVSLCSTDTPYNSTFTATPDNTVFSNHFYQWQESVDGITWTDIPGETNQSLTVIGITSTMYYKAKVAEYAINISNPDCITFSDVFSVIVNPILTPTFTQITPICSGDTLSALATTSNNGVTGTWSPSVDNTTTTIYTFTPNLVQCATSQAMTIVVNPILTPTFTQITPICSGDTLSALPTASNNGITGTWSPSVDNTTTTVYTFTPNSGQCATSQNMTIVVNPILTPTFTQVAAICSGEALSALPTTSNNGIIGTWSPSVDNTTTTVYTFTPNSGQCAAIQNMTIVVNPILSPTFTQVAAICSGDTLSALPTTSNNGITGTWSPSLDNTITTVYTFTPNVGACATSQTMTISVNPNQSPTFNQVAPICTGETLPPLPTISNNGVTGTWSPALNNTATTTYTFTPDPGFCPSPVSITIPVFGNPVFSLLEEHFLCLNPNGTVAIPITIDTGLNTSDYNFTWLLSGVPIIGANQASYMPIEGGDYEVMVQNTITMCESTLGTTVTVLSAPEFEAEVISNAFSENQTILVTPINTGEFEYQLDHGVWQEEPVFNNVAIGEHQVKARDKRGCIESNVLVVVMGYPKYFTPNGDGFNDTWNIVAPTNPVNYLASAKIYIFNRYGKLLKQLSPTSSGWNGFFNGAIVPTDDYWFLVEYNEPNSNNRKEFTGHFTLKR